MKIESINKSIYRKHLNIVIICSIVAFASLSLAVSQGMIWLFTDREGTHFWLNVLGVVVGGLITGGVLRAYRDHPFMYEVYYVWRLKQQINYIIRKQKRIEAQLSSDNANVDAFVVMSFFYHACEALYTLDDNTLTMSTVKKKHAELNAQIDALNLDVSYKQYDPNLLKQF